MGRREDQISPLLYISSSLLLFLSYSLYTFLSFLLPFSNKIEKRKKEEREEKPDMSQKCTTAESKSNQHKITHPLYPFCCLGRGQKNGGPGGGPVDDPSTPHPKNHATAAHAAAHTPDDKGQKN